MSPSYRLSSTAEADLRGILDFLADREGIERALHIHGKFEEAFARLAGAPHIAPTRPRLTGDRVRWFRVFRWIVVYDPATTPLLILRVIDGRREIETMLPVFEPPEPG